MASGNEFGLSRRDALISASASAALAAAPSSAAPRPTPTSVGSPPSMHKISLQVNGATHLLDLDTRTTLLDALREHLQLRGPKKGRHHGQCGAGIVLVDDRRSHSCLILAGMHSHDTTPQLADAGAPHH